MSARTLVDRRFYRHPHHQKRTNRLWRSVIRRLPLSLELLEDRLAPAQVTWTGKGNDLSWNDGLNWSGGTGLNGTPGPTDQVVINQTGITVTQSGQNVTI